MCHLEFTVSGLRLLVRFELQFLYVLQYPDSLGLYKIVAHPANNLSGTSLISLEQYLLLVYYADVP